MGSAHGVKTTPNMPEASVDEAQQRQSQDVTRKLVELFGDADQTSISMQGSKFHSDSGKFSGVQNADAREKLRAAGLLAD